MGHLFVNMAIIRTIPMLVLHTVITGPPGSMAACLSERDPGITVAGAADTMAEGITVTGISIAGADIMATEGTEEVGAAAIAAVSFVAKAGSAAALDSAAAMDSTVAVDSMVEAASTGVDRPTVVAVFMVAVATAEVVGNIRYLESGLGSRQRLAGFLFCKWLRRELRMAHKH